MEPRTLLPLVPLEAPTAPPRTPALIPACHDDVCITCSDAAVEVRVVQIHEGELATVDTGSGHELVSIALVDAAVGDLVLVHAKEAIGRVAGPTAEGGIADDLH